MKRILIFDDPTVSDDVERRVLLQQLITSDTLPCYCIVALSLCPYWATLSEDLYCNKSLVEIKQDLVERYPGVLLTEVRLWKYFSCLQIWWYH